MKDEIKFEDLINRLDEIVKRLEGEELDLDESLALFEEGVKLARVASKKLEEVKRKIEMVLDEDGEPKIVPFE